MRQTILITGGTGKFGRKFVEYFSEKDWEVLFTSTNLDRASELVASLKRPNKTKAFICDLSSLAASVSLVNEIQAAGYKVNHLVNNARSLLSLGTDRLGQTNRSDFMAEYLMDVVVPYELSIALFNAQATSLNTIINIGSQYGIVAANPNLYEDYPRQSPIQYGVAKAALGHLTKELAVRFSEHSIRVNCIAYGGVDGRVDSDFKDRYSSLVPSGRMLKDSELVGPLEFLTGESSSAMTGHILIADGGWTVW
ncbi:MAG: NAD(P)-dependent dehydrogenase (short-subunit alcohol dehydrogenase family) [Candidatus Azotimanducaceae bacterium]|jgi:NAD(P)-dependent dehydrogenase (short-subunit alcohol dehydrogenase family)